MDGRLRRVDLGREVGFGSVAYEQRSQNGRTRMCEGVQQVRCPTVHVLFNIE